MGPRPPPRQCVCPAGARPRQLHRQAASARVPRRLPQMQTCCWPSKQLSIMEPACFPLGRPAPTPVQVWEERSAGSDCGSSALLSCHQSYAGPAPYLLPCSQSLLISCTPPCRPSDQGELRIRPPVLHEQLAGGQAAGCAHAQQQGPEWVLCNSFTQITHTILQGIWCDGSGHVNVIDLSGLGLTGAIPPGGWALPASVQARWDWYPAAVGTTWNLCAGGAFWIRQNEGRASARVGCAAQAGCPGHRRGRAHWCVLHRVSSAGCAP